MRDPLTKLDLTRIVVGNVLATLHDHGPIDARGALSAAKRIAGALHAELLRRGMAEPTRSGTRPSRAPEAHLDPDDEARGGVIPA